MKTLEQEWRTRFGRYAERHSAEHLVSGWSPRGLARRVALVQTLLRTMQLSPAARVLDLGCGGGTYVRLLARLGYRPTGLDYSLPTLARAVAADGGNAARYVAGEAYALPYAGDSFDLVISIGVLQTLSTPERALDEMVRVLRPGGRLIVEALNRCAVSALVRRIAGVITGTPPRLRQYDPREVQGWLRQRALTAMRQAAVFLPPRRLPSLERVLGCPRWDGPMNRHSRLAEVAAHAFLFLAAKPGRPDEHQR